jgi:hypothetical protein
LNDAFFLARSIKIAALSCSAFHDPSDSLAGRPARMATTRPWSSRTGVAVLIKKDQHRQVDGINLRAHLPSQRLSLKPNSEPSPTISLRQNRPLVGFLSSLATNPVLVTSSSLVCRVVRSGFDGRMCRPVALSFEVSLGSSLLSKPPTASRCRHNLFRSFDLSFLPRVADGACRDASDRLFFRLGSDGSSSSESRELKGEPKGDTTP